MSTATTSKSPAEIAYESSTIGQLVAEKAGRARILEKYNIDYCCGGKGLLSDACAKAGLDYAAVAEELYQYDASHAGGGVDWLNAPLSELADHISQTHHVHLREELPRLEFLAEKVRNAHSAKHPELAELYEVVKHLSQDLQEHTNKEEETVFPCIKKLEAAKSGADLGCDSIADPIRQMEAEHDDAGADLEKIKELTNNYIPPNDTCNTHRVLLDSLREFELETHTHVHKENSILFPRTIARENELRAS